MKKIFAVTAAIAVCLTFISCGGNNSTPEDTFAIEQYVKQASETAQTEVTASVTTEKITEVTTAEKTFAATEETTVTEQEYMENEEYLIGFLSYLQHKGFVEGEKNYFAFEQGNSFDQYDFMDDFKIDGYSYEHRGGGVYDVKLTCSESTCELFPNGDSYWVYGRGFFPAEREEKMQFSKDMLDIFDTRDMKDTLKTAFYAAVDFSFYTKTFEADKEWFENYTKAGVHGFYHAYNPYMEKDELTESVYPEEQIRAVKLLYNISIPIESFDYLKGDTNDGFSYTNENERVFSRCWHGAGWNYYTFAGYEENDDEITVLVDYYGDEMYFYPVIESEYTFSKNEDGSITLQQVEKIFDKGYKLASGSV